MDNTPRILMCRPDHYGIEYEINPWMHRENQADRDLAVRQWEDLRAVLEDLGARIALIESRPGLPDMVFTANAGLIFGDSVVVSRFRHANRQGEQPHFARWFGDHGFNVMTLPEDMYFEGAGDVLFCGSTMFAGYRFRSDIRALQHVAALLGQRVIPLELMDPHFYHLDTCFCPLSLGSAIYFPGAFDGYGQDALRQWIPDLLEVSVEEARRFACNAVVVGRTVVLHEGCVKLRADLASRGFATIETPLGEFLKSGGSAKCLTLRLDGEEAAAWRQDRGGGRLDRPYAGREGD